MRKHPNKYTTIDHKTIFIALLTIPGGEKPLIGHQSGELSEMTNECESFRETVLVQILSQTTVFYDSKSHFSHTLQVLLYKAQNLTGPLWQLDN
jgi:hypothetical protein